MALCHKKSYALTSALTSLTGSLHFSPSKNKRVLTAGCLSDAFGFIDDICTMERLLAAELNQLVIKMKLQS